MEENIKRWIRDEYSDTYALISREKLEKEYENGISAMTASKLIGIDKVIETVLKQAVEGDYKSMLLNYGTARIMVFDYEAKHGLSDAELYVLRAYFRDVEDKMIELFTNKEAVSI